MRSTVKGPVTRAGWALREYLTGRRQTIAAFAEKHALKRVLVQRGLNGAGKRFTVDFATDIERATDGQIPAAWWRSDTATKKPPEKSKGAANG